MPEEDVYRCPAGEKLKFHYANEEDAPLLDERRARTWQPPRSPNGSLITLSLGVAGRLTFILPQESR